MKRGNHTGCVKKLSGKRRKPWAVITSEGYDEQGRQIRKYRGYFETKKAALLFLEGANSRPDESDMTVSEAWEGWQRVYQGSKNTIGAYKSGYKRLAKLKDTRLRDLTLAMMQEAVDTPPRTYATCRMVKKVLSVILDYGFSHDACPASRRELLQYIVLPERQTKEKSTKRFTDDEIQDVIDRECVLAVVLLFTGLRLHELMGLSPDDIDLEGQELHIRKSKTPAGVRSVPIPDRLIPWLKRYLQSGAVGRSKEWLYRNMWNPYDINNHVRHDCRHTYISILTESGTDERLVKALCGHAGGVTADVYTHYTNSVKLDAVNAAFNRYLPAVVGEDLDYSERLSA